MGLTAFSCFVWYAPIAFFSSDLLILFRNFSVNNPPTVSAQILIPRQLTAMSFSFS